MPQDTPTLALTKQLIAKPSVTPKDLGCQDILTQRLSGLGFHCQKITIGEVDNLWAILGDSGPLFCFAGHTDVVPVGDSNNWTFPPFTPTEHEGYLWGRGTADMKGGIAAFIVALEGFLSKHKAVNFRISLLITSDEEGPAVDGIKAMMAWLKEQKLQIDWCLVGEPSSNKRIGDQIKNGRRGSLGGTLTINGVQGHIAYPHLADNPIHRALPAINELTELKWDLGNAFFPPTQFQISNVNAGTGATNVIPADIDVVFNFRFSTETTADQLKQVFTSVLDKHGVNYDIQWKLFGEPFLTAKGLLVAAIKQAIVTTTGIDTKLSTSGGTSDGRFIALSGAQVVELGLVNETIHQVDERIAIADLEILKDTYIAMLVELEKSVL